MTGRDILLRTKVGVGADTDYAATNAIPAAADLGGIPYVAPPGQDTIHRLEVTCIPIDTNGAPLARAGTFSMRLVKVIERSALGDQPAGDDTDLSVDTVLLTGVSFNTLNDIPFGGGKYTVALSAIAGAPGATTHIEIWVRAVIR